MLIDTHAHLNFPDYQKDLDQVVKRAIDNGVTKIICVSSNIADSKRAIEIAKKFSGTVFAAVGIHPQQTDSENNDSLENQIKALRKLAENKQVVAIGECGLDFSPAPPGEKDRTKDQQDFLFLEQIKIAEKLNLPIIIHTREAFRETAEVLKDHFKLLNKKGVIHCYYAGKKGIAIVNEIGFYFGFDGNLTYDSGLQTVATKISLDKIILETDSPFLTPAPHRSLRNEPANVKIVAETLARIKTTTIEEIATITSQNALKLFAIK